MPSQHNSWKTATNRSQPSRPARWLVKQGLISGRVLDFGCGFGTDADRYQWIKWDPHHWQKRPRGLFDVVLCTYVLNTIPYHEEREAIVDEVKSYLRNEGSRAYISVRADSSALNGWTKRRTWQGLIMLEYPVVHKAIGFRIYELTK